MIIEQHLPTHEQEPSSSMPAFVAGVLDAAIVCLAVSDRDLDGDIQLAVTDVDDDPEPDRT